MLGDYLDLFLSNQSDFDFRNGKDAEVKKALTIALRELGLRWSSQDERIIVRKLNSRNSSDVQNALVLLFGAFRVGWFVGMFSGRGADTPRCLEFLGKIILCLYASKADVALASLKALRTNMSEDDIRSVWNIIIEFHP